MLSLAGVGEGDSLADIGVFHDWNTGSIEAPPHSAGGGAWRSEAGQVLTDTGDQLVEAAGVLGVDPAAVQSLALVQRLAAGLLSMHYLHGRVGWIKPLGLALRQPLRDHRIRRLAIEYQEGHASGLGRLPGILALLLLQVCRVDYHGKASLQRSRCQLVQPLVGLIAGLLAVDTGIEVALLGFGLLAMQALRSEEHTSELQSLMRISYAVFCLKKKK